MVDSPNRSIAETHAHTWMGSRCCNKATQSLRAVSLRVARAKRTGSSNDVEQKASEQSWHAHAVLGLFLWYPSCYLSGEHASAASLKNLHSYDILVREFLVLPVLASQS